MQSWVVTPSASRLLVPATDVAHMVNAIASQDRVALASAVLQTVQGVMPVQHCSVLVHEAARSPRLLSGGGSSGPWIAFKMASLFARSYFQYDALQGLMARRPAMIDEGQVVVCRVRRDDVALAEYRQACFDQFGIADRLSVLLRTGKTGWLSVNLFRGSAEGLFSARDIDALLGLAPLLASCAARHHASDIDGEAGFRDTVTDGVGELCPSLTVREREVLMRILDGVTVNRIAEDLKLRPTTVATYRMRAYEKLGVCSRRELFATVLRQQSGTRPAIRTAPAAGFKNALLQAA